MVEGVNEVGVDVALVTVAATVAVFVVVEFSSVLVADVVSSTVGVLDGRGVFEGRTVFVGAGIRLGVKEGSAVACVVGVGVSVVTLG